MWKCYRIKFNAKNSVSKVIESLEKSNIRMNPKHSKTNRLQKKNHWIKYECSIKYLGTKYSNWSIQIKSFSIAIFILRRKSCLDVWMEVTSETFLRQCTTGWTEENIRQTYWYLCASINLYDGWKLLPDVSLQGLSEVKTKVFPLGRRFN